MSFVISIGGVAAPYKYDSSHHNEVKEIHQSNPPSQEFRELLRQTLIEDSNSNKKQGSRQKVLSAYLKQQQAKKKSMGPTVRSLMTQHPYTITQNGTIEQAIELLNLHKIQHLPVVEHKKVVGILSDRDLIKCGLSGTRDVGSVMTKQVLAVYPETRMIEASKVMIQEEIHCLPVCSEALELLGIITSSDLFRFIIQSFPIEIYG